MKQVRETKAGKAISAFIVMRGARQVATVQAHYSDAGVVTVDVFQHGASAEKSAKAAGVPVESMYWQHGRAGGYGYDKLTAALSGLYVDGVEILDHSRSDKKAQNLSRRYEKAISEAVGPMCDQINKAFEEKARRIGAAPANFTVYDADSGSVINRAFIGRDENGRPMYAMVSLAEREKASRENRQPEPFEGRTRARWGGFYTVSGLDRLPYLGYNVIRAI